MDTLELTRRTLRRSAYVDLGDDKVDQVIGRLVLRRSFLFYFALENFLQEQHFAREALTVIGSAHRASEFLRLPGSADDGVLRVGAPSAFKCGDHGCRLSTLDLHPLHQVPFYRPSRESTIQCCRGVGGPLVPSQRLSQLEANDGDRQHDDSDDHLSTGSTTTSTAPVMCRKSEFERLRLVVFGHRLFPKIFFFLDCYVPTEMHALAIRSLVSRSSVAPGAHGYCDWDPAVLSDMVVFFWDCLQAFTVRLKHFYSSPEICGAKLSRKLKKSILRFSRVLLFHSISFWTVELLSQFGFDPSVLDGFSTMDSALFGASSYARVKSLRLLSLSFRQKSKIPKLLGPDFAALVDHHYRPVIEQLWRLHVDFLAIHEPEADMHLPQPLLGAADSSLCRGESPIDNPLTGLFEALVEFLPLAADRLRCDGTELKKRPRSWPDVGPTTESSTANKSKRRKKKKKKKNEESQPATNQEITLLDGEVTVSGGDVSAGAPSTSRGISSGISNGAEGTDVSPKADCQHTVSTSTSHPPSARRVSHYLSSSGERVLCPGCRDILFGFFSSRVDRGISPSQIGRNLWAGILLRRQSASSPSAHPPTSLSNTVTDAGTVPSDEQSPVRRLFPSGLSAGSQSPQSPQSPTHQSPQFPHSQSATPIDISQQHGRTHFPFSPSVSSDAEDSHHQHPSTTDVASSVKNIGHSQASTEVGSDGEYELH